MMTPDPAGMAAADLSNPQSLNRYAYVLNNPLRWRDPLGLDQCAWDDGTIDDRPEDGGASESECGAQGGKWIGGTDTTMNVSANQEGGVTVIIFGGPAGFITYPADPGGGGGSDQTCGTSGVHLSGGLSYGGNADAGAGTAGLTATASAGAGVFYDSKTGTSAGAFAGGGAARQHAGEHCVYIRRH